MPFQRAINLACFIRFILCLLLKYDQFCSHYDNGHTLYPATPSPPLSDTPIMAEVTGWIVASRLTKYILIQEKKNCSVKFAILKQSPYKKEDENPYSKRISSPMSVDFV